MKIRIPVIFIMSLLFSGAFFHPAFALEHTQKDGLFSMDIPREWHWVEYSQEIIIAYPDGKSVAIDIQMVPSRKLSMADIKKDMKEADDKMIKEGVEAHNGTLIDDKEINLDGLYAKRLDFKTAPPNPILVTCVSFFHKDHAFTVSYGSEDDKMHSMLDDTLATIKFK